MNGACPDTALGRERVNEEKTPANGSEKLSPDRGTQGDQDSRMTLKQMQEAIDDESHPQHEEALRQSKRLADTMMPALQSLQRQVAAQLDLRKAFEGITFPTAQNLGLTGLHKSFVKSIGSALPMPNVMPKMNWTSRPPESMPTPPAIDPAYQNDFEEIADGFAEAAREREERAQRQVEMAAAQLDSLQAMAANLQQLNRQIESVDQRLSLSNKSARTSFGWSITVGALTLAATIVGIIVTVILSQS